MENIMLNGKYEKKLGVYWYKNGKLHREDGPAIEWYSGAMSWYKNGVQHREDGPAFVQPNGKNKWFIKGEEVTQENFKYLTEKQDVMYS